MQRSVGWLCRARNQRKWDVHMGRNQLTGQSERQEERSDDRRDAYIVPDLVIGLESVDWIPRCMRTISPVQLNLPVAY